MAFEAVVVPFQISTGAATTTQDITSSGFGTPTAAIVFLSRATADDKGLDTHWGFSIGMTDGTNEFVCAQFGNGTASTSDTSRSGTTALVQATTASIVSGEASFNSFITDGLRITIDNDFSTAWHGYVILMKGADNVAVGETTLSTGTADINVGFKPDFLIATTYLTTLTADINNSMSWATRDPLDDSITQRSVHTFADDASGGAAVGKRISTTKIAASTTGGSVVRELSIDEWRTDGFGITHSGTTGDLQIAYLAVKLPSGQVAECGLGTSPASATTHTISPAYADDSELFMMLHTINDTTTYVTNDNADSWSFGATDGTNQAVIGVKEDDGNTIMQSRTAFSSADIALTFNGSGTAQHEADVTNLDTPDIDLNYSTAATAEDYIWLAVQKGAAAAGGSLKSLTLTGVG